MLTSCFSFLIGLARQLLLVLFLRIIYRTTGHLYQRARWNDMEDIPEFLDSGRKCWILNSGCWTLDAGLKTLEYELWMLDSGRLFQDSGLWTLDCGCWTPYLGCWALNTGHYRWLFQNGIRAQSLILLN